MIAGVVFAVGFVAFVLNPSVPLAIFDSAAFVPVLLVFKYYFASEKSSDS